MWVLSAFTLLLILYWVREYVDHRRNLKKIRIRIHVNGTRGKSSTTRLIAGILREHGFKTVAKATGTEPRVIFDDGREIEVIRPGRSNIIEQVRVIKFAAKIGADAVVLECMALRPDFQIMERRMVCPTIGIITNVRADHLDVMGPTVEDAAKALAGTIPYNGVFITASREFFPLLKEIAEQRGTKAYLVSPDDVPDDYMRGFSYIEHKENVAIALKVAEILNIPRETALKGMYNANPDVGVLRIYEVRKGNKRIKFVNAFAANDPDSLKIIWDLVKNRGDEKVVLMNCRDDRIDRSRQLGELLAKRLEPEPVMCITTGALTSAFIKSAVENGYPEHKILNLEGIPPEEAYGVIVDKVPDNCLIFAMGNMVTYGERLAEVFRRKSEEVQC